MQLVAAVALLLLVFSALYHCTSRPGLSASGLVAEEAAAAARVGASARKLLDRQKSLIGYSEGPSDCRDSRGLCINWADSGECSRNPGYMVMNCRKSCKACLPDPIADIARENKETIVMTIKSERIRIALKAEWAPNVVKKVSSLADQKKCDNCYFYRSEEPAQQIPGEDRNTGPPYGLLQGHFGTKIVAGAEDRKRGMPEVQAAMVCLIGDSSDFLIAVDDHPEWGNSHIVFGIVYPDDMETVLNFVQTMPAHPETWGSTHVQVLNDRVPFEINRQKQGEVLDVSAEDVWTLEDW